MATQRPGDEQIRQRLDNSITRLDNHRTDSLERTGLLQTNKDSALKKEQARLSKKYGADHPRVAKIIKRLDYNQAALPEMKAEVDRSRIQTPELNVKTWMVHGRVLNQKLTGIKGLTLALYDSDGKVEKRLAYACTDERGYYAIRYQFKEGESSPFDPDADYFLVVSDGKGNVCHKEEAPLHVIIGQTDYRLIVLDGVKCTPPPEWCKGDDGGDSETGEWTVVGAVSYDNNKPGAGLVVHMLDKKEKKEIATTKTDRAGVFKFIFTIEKDPDLFKTKPDLFVAITDSKGKQLYINKEPLQPKVGGVEELKITLNLEIRRQRKPRR